MNIQGLIERKLLVNDPEEAADWNSCLADDEPKLVAFWEPASDTILHYNTPQGGWDEPIFRIFEYDDGDFLIMTSQGTDRVGEYTVRPDKFAAVSIDAYVKVAARV